MVENIYNMAIIKIKNLRLRTIIGINIEEREKLQDIVINIKIKYNDIGAVNNDNVDQAIDYKKITKNIIKFVEGSHFYMLEKLVDEVIILIMQDEKVLKTQVTIDKPHALRFADSVSVTKIKAKSR